MTTFPALPSATDCIGPAIDVLVDNPANTIPGYGNPKRLDHINYGVGNWANVLAGWQAQAVLNLRRVSDEMMQARLPLARGRGLRELAASKYFINVVDTPTTAIGQIQINPVVGPPPPGTIFIIPAGTRFRRTANPKALPVPITAAEYVSTVDVKSVWGVSNYNPINIPIMCTASGPAGNIVIEQEAQQEISGFDVTIVDQLYNSDGTPRAFAVVSTTCAGGSTSFSDVEVRAIAGAQPQGRRGPTEGAIYAGALLALGVRHAAVFEDLVNANTILFVADESWASDTAFWQPAVIQQLVDQWAGFGCSINPTGAGIVDNIFLDIECTVQVRSQQLLQSTTGIQAAITSKLNDYFNNRPDWWTFRTQAIGALIARADPRILTCSSVTITDRFGVPVADPPLIPLGSAPSALTHYNLTSLSPTFVAPV